jgi:hypothetical protein
MFYRERPPPRRQRGSKSRIIKQAQTSGDPRVRTIGHNHWR